MGGEGVVGGVDRRSQARGRGPCVSRAGFYIGVAAAAVGAREGNNLGKIQLRRGTLASGFPSVVDGKQKVEKLQHT